MKLAGRRILAADLSITCSGIVLFELDTMLPYLGRCFADDDPGPSLSLYERAHRVADAIAKADLLPFHFVAFEGPALSARYRTEETTAIRQAFYSRFRTPESTASFIPRELYEPFAVNPEDAKAALTGKRKATKTEMLNAARSQTRGTAFYSNLDRLIVPGRKHNLEAESIADAFGVARAAAKIIFQRNARESYLAGASKTLPR